MRQAAILMALALAAGLGGTAAAGPEPDAIAVTRAWSRATPPGTSVGVAYFELVNSGAPDVLTAIESRVARRVEMHATMMADGMMQMRQTDAVVIPAHARIVFAPSGLHAMLIDLKKPLREGDRLPLTLIFKHASRVHVEAVVQGLSGN